MILLSLYGKISSHQQPGSEAALNNLLRPHFLLLLTGTSLSIFIAYFFSVYHNNEQRRIFETKAATIGQAFIREANAGVDVLTFLSSAFEPDRKNSENFFKHYADQILLRRPEIKALEWVPVVPHAQRSNFEARMRKLYPDFNITQQAPTGEMTIATRRDQYFPVMLVEPLTGNEAALGFDLASNKTRWQIMQKALKTKQMQATPGVQLVQDKSVTNGFIVFKPVFSDKQAGNKADLRGYLLAVYHVNALFSAAIQNHDHTGLALNLIDRSEPQQQQLLYSMGVVSEKASGLLDNVGIAYSTVIKNNFDSSPPLIKTIDIELAGRNWQLQINPMKGHSQSGLSRGTVLLFLAGMVITLLASGYVLQLGRHNLQLKKNNGRLSNEINERIQIQKQLNETNQKLARLSREDPLLGIANRRYLNEYLDSEWLRAIRSGFPLSFIMADIDYFKQYNDTYGHVIGDQCLKKVALLLSEAANRPADMVARYGGEEFAIVLPESFENGAIHIVQNIQNNLRQLAIPHSNSDTSPYLTISFGIGTIHPNTTMNLPVFISNVDDALYAAKAAGRNGYKTATITPARDIVQPFNKLQNPAK